jgi:hypothetical protein
MKKLFFTLSLLLLITCSKDSTEDNSSVYVAPPTNTTNPTTTPSVTQYTLTVTAGTGGSVSTAGGTYNDGTSISIIATPNEGYGFVGWNGSDSSSSTISVTLTANTTIEALFGQLPQLTLPDTPSKMFTKGVGDTLSIGFSHAGGYKSTSLSAEYGSVSVISEPNEGDAEGNIVIEYTVNSVENVDWTRTIAGTDNIQISFIGADDLASVSEYQVRTQPEPIYKDYLKSNLETKTSRIKVDPHLIRFLNQRDNFNQGCYIGENFGDPNNYNLNGNTFDNIRDMGYLDINLDGYEDIVMHPIYWDGSNGSFASVKTGIEFYLYDNGKYVYTDIRTQNGFIPEAFLTVKFLIGDFDNDGNPDIYAGNHGTDSEPYIDENQFFLFNDYNQLGYFTILENNFNRNSHFMASADIDNDGDLDVFGGGMYPCDRGSKSCDFLINNGGRSFSEGDIMNEVTHNGSKSYFFRNISTSDIFDVDGDGYMDLLLHGKGVDDNYASFQGMDIEEIESIPFQASSGKILFGNSNSNFSLDQLKYFPTIDGYNKGLDFNVYDLDGDGKNEIIILLTGDGSIGEWISGGNDNDNQLTTNWYQGYQIQITQLDENRNIIDVTENFMNGNGQTGVGLGCDNENFMFLQISDFDNDGLIDMYCEDSRIGPNFIRWEWNGSKFSKVD